jgi:hypothetical protein
VATRAFTPVDENIRSKTGTWTGLTQTTADDGAPLELPDYADRSIQIQGTLGVGGSLNIEGSNDGTNYVLLTDPQGNNLTITAVGRMEQIQEITRFLRPRVTAGDGTTSFNVTFYGVRRA